MPNFRTVLAALQAAQTGIHNRPLDSRLSSGRLLALATKYVIAGTEAANDTIQLFRVTKGMLLVPQLGRIYTETGWATSMTVKIGINYDSASLTDDDDAFAASLALAAGNKDFNLPAPYEVLGDGWVVATITATVDPVADKALHFVLPFLAP